MSLINVQTATAAEFAQATRRALAIRRLALQQPGADRMGAAVLRHRYGFCRPAPTSGAVGRVTAHKELPNDNRI